MRAQTIWQPYASAIAMGLKVYETRTWRPRLHMAKQLVAIHAGKTFYRDALLPPQVAAVLGHYLPRGAIVAVAYLEGVYQAECVARDFARGSKKGSLELELGDFSSGRWAWKYTKVCELAMPIPMLGMQGLWNITDETIVNQLRGEWMESQ